MADFVSTCDLLSARLESLNPTGLPIAWENSGFDPVASGQDGWLYVEIAELTRSLASIGDAGTRLERGYGEMHVWCYMPTGTRDTAKRHAQSINDLFSFDQVSGVDIIERMIGKGKLDGSGNVSIGRWYGVPVVIGFQFDVDNQ